MEERKKRSRGETQNVSYRSDRHRCRVRRDEDVPDAHLQDDEVLLSLFAKFAGKSKKSDSINGKKVKKETVDLKNRLRNPGEWNANEKQQCTEAFTSDRAEPLHAQENVSMNSPNDELKNIIAEFADGNIGNERYAKKSKTYFEVPMTFPQESKNNTGTESVRTKNLSKYSLSDLVEMLLQKVIVIRHEDALYYYNGRTYDLIDTEQRFLEVIVNKVDLTGFGCMGIRKFSECFSYIKAREDLIPRDYEKRLKEAKYFVVLKNGVLDLRSLELRKHSPEYLTFYELKAKWTGKRDTEFFEKFLNQISDGDQQIRTRIQEVMGYLMSSLNDGKCFFVMGTAPDSGKSTIGNLLREIIGERYIAYRATYQLSNRFSLGDTQGKLINMAMDLPKGKLDAMTVALLKQITGGDLITVEKKYENMRSIRSKMRFLFASNYPVVIPKVDDDTAFWERMIIIPFEHSVPKPELDHELLEKLFQEKNSIVTRCLCAVHKVVTRNFSFSHCAVADNMKKRWRYQLEDISGTIEQYVSEKLTVTGNVSDKVYLQDIYLNYRKYCTQQGLMAVTYEYFSNWLKMTFQNCEFRRIRCASKDNPRIGVIGMCEK